MAATVRSVSKMTLSTMATRNIVSSAATELSTGPVRLIKIKKDPLKAVFRIVSHSFGYAAGKVVLTGIRNDRNGQQNRGSNSSIPSQCRIGIGIHKTDWPL